MYGAPAKNCSGPENRDASILVGKHRANAKEFVTLSELRDSVELLATAGLVGLGWLDGKYAPGIILASYHLIIF